MPKKKPVKEKRPVAKQKKAVVRSASGTTPKPVESEEKATDRVQAKNQKTPALLRGMKDILPKEGVMWRAMEHAAENIATAYGFSWVDTPVVEEAGLFVRSIGRGTDVVDKEMYVFEDKDGTRVALRPEMTASMVRSYITHGLHNVSQPVKFWHIGPLFRHDRPQAGRYRQFHQFDCETLGERDPVLDAELIVMAYNFLLDLGIKSNVLMNSIGTLADRERYIVELVGYLRSKRTYLSEESKYRLQKNPLRILDSKDEQDRAVLEEAPQILDWLSEESKTYFMKVLEYLDEVEVPYILDSTLVRGLDYYTDTVFELVEEGAPDKAQGALGGGGRYDGLVEQLGGKPTPACGFAIGMERVAGILRRQAEEAGTDPYEEKSPVFFAQLGEQARRRALRLVEDIRRQGIIVRHSLGKGSLKTQMELANKAGARHTIILGQKEVQDGTIIIRDMESGIQEIIDQKKLHIELQKLFANRLS